MTAATATVSLRLSSVANACPRKAVYEATGAPGRERTEREDRWLFRGRRLGRDYADWLAAKYGEDAIERERKITWPLGVGHADVYIKETRTVVEILSSAHASEAQRHGKLLQMVAYIEHDPAAENGVLVVLNPTDFSEDRIVLSPRSGMYADLVEEMRGRVAQVLAWRETGELPARVCGKPSESHGRFCLHAEHCFQGWEPPPVEEITASEEIVAAVAELDTLKRQRLEAGRQDKSIEARQKELQAVLDAAELPAGKFQVGPFQVTRSPRTRAGGFDWKKAEAAGLLNVDALSEFFKRDTVYVVYDVERTGQEDFGEVPW